MMNKSGYFIDSSTQEDIKNHLLECCNHFIPPLDTYVEIAEYSEKIYSKSCRFEFFEEGILRGLVAMYVNDKGGFITNFSVSPESMGLGISKKLLDLVVKYLDENSLKEVDLSVNKLNYRAINFYEKNGFLPISEEKENIIMKKETKRNYNKELLDTADHKYAYNFDFDVMHHYMMESFIPFFVEGSVLELGSFKGDFTKRLLPHFKDITCVEASDEAIEEAKMALPDNIVYYNSLFEETTLPRKYDNIILTHVLEHIDDPVGLIRKIKEEWISDKGKLFIVCPNANAPSRQIAVKMGLIDHNSAITPSEKEHGHRITYTLDTLERDAVKAGMKVNYRTGIFFKALANFQWDRLLQTDIISNEYLDGCYKLGHHYPDLCSSIMLVCTK